MKNLIRPIVVYVFTSLLPNLVNILSITKSQMTASVDKLIALGYVERKSDDSGRRKIYLSIIKEGIHITYRIKINIERFGQDLKETLIIHTKIGRLTNIGLVLLSLGIGISSNSCVSSQIVSQTRQEAQKKEDLDNKVAKYYGDIRITFEDKRINRWPYQKEVNINLIPEYDRDRKYELLSGELDKYPYELLEENIDEVFFVKKIILNGHAYGGLRKATDTKRVMVRDYEVFHAEFSSVLFFNYGKMFPKKQWRKINRGYKYTKDADKVIDDNINYPNKPFADPKLSEQGFVTRYATTSLENDYNMIIDELYLHPERLFRNCKKFPKLQMKTNLTIEFLSQIQGIDLNEQYFIDLQKH